MWRRVRTVLVLLLCVSVPVLAEQGSQGNGNGQYRAGVGDVITVESFQHDEISGEFLVEDGGFLTYPFLGPVPVEDLTCAEIGRRLEQLLERDYYVDVQLVVEVAQYRSKPVTVLGEVGKPGTYYLKGPTNLLQILVEAGGIRSSAGGEVELRRRPDDGSTQNAQQVMTFSTAEVISGEQGGDILLATGDVIVVLSAKAEYFITGEVARPGRYEVTQGMTVLQALSEAGGEAKFSSGVIELHREVEGQKQIYEFSLGHIRKGRVADPEIRAGDVLILRRRFF